MTVQDKDTRIGEILGTGSGDPSFVLAGCPVDEGVARNNGRPGAASAPRLIRDQLFRMTPPALNCDRFSAIVKNGRDLGDIPSDNMEAMQENLGRTIQPWLEKQRPVIIMGGGHETSYGHFLGYQHAGIAHVIMNLDAHTDVRPLKKGAGHSGSPFRQILGYPDTKCRRYHVAGLQPHAVSKSHLDYIKENDGKTFFKDETEISVIRELLEEAAYPLFVTLDMDAVDQSVAPGVSAPCADGISKSLLLQAAWHAGRNPNVTSIDIAEVNPAFDVDSQTVRLAALTIWKCIEGLASRF
ncbi:formimidoylglutamase [Natronogracilivirga saccharolytica]|uniref:Formimidoylglutamase n=1 Tax=Natronogracilivirga saccharolytica TaxID=2812953 RepID=A0A8J7S3U5_9BACT|nr:formimidoylglutamase [Natronogracilivirga saccharolytica]MBP3191488.1 formimidoylglutamase [Natronogracilivirga saccharolytica]